jgi:hypothetical protein
MQLLHELNAQGATFRRPRYLLRGRRSLPLLCGSALSLFPPRPPLRRRLPPVVRTPKGGSLGFPSRGAARLLLLLLLRVIVRVRVAAAGAGPTIPGLQPLLLLLLLLPLLLGRTLRSAR